MPKAGFTSFTASRWLFWRALGASFSALEVVPLVLIGLDAFRFFVAVAFWNLVGAGLFGFMINPPIALDYMQGLNTNSANWAI